ncbi:MAG: hypothetical protein JOY93_03230, partial [Acidobacteriales bacterium]|nr:hypothetical protein [Terriglobales bacterium]
MDSGPIYPTTPGNGHIVRELRPAIPGAFGAQLTPGFYPSPPTEDSILREYLRVLIKRKWIVITSVVLIFGVVLIATLRSTPIYDA